MMYRTLSSVERDYDIRYVHNKKHFYQNRVWIEEQANGQLVLKGIPRPHSKRFTRIGILKAKDRPKTTKKSKKTKKAGSFLDMMNGLYGFYLISLGAGWTIQTLIA